MDGTVLVADDDRTIRTVLTQALTRAGCKVHATSSLMTLMRWVDEGKGDLVISDVIMPDGNGLETLPQINDKRPGLPVIVISAQNTIMTAIQATEADAYDYLPKPFDLPDLMKRAARALDQKRRATRAETRRTITHAQQDDLPLVGRTPSMQALYRLVARVMNTELPVLITGEAGPAKPDRARDPRFLGPAHAALRRRCAQRSGATMDGPSATVIARAKGGSILFDEVGDLGEAAQGKIVRMLDAMGDSAPRVMATSQKDLMERMEAGEFRQDLFYRLGGVTIAVPSLRERVDDIPLLAEHFLPAPNATGSRRAASPRRDGADPRLFLARQRAAAGKHHPPADRDQPRGRDHPPRDRDGPGLPARDRAADRRRSGDKLSASVAKHLRRYFDLHGGVLPPPGLYARILKEVEMPLIEIALEATGGNQAKCADCWASTAIP
jgi:two-component system nitrogen regulation response regulator GlnG